METITLNNLVEQINDEILNWRRYLHQHPELSFKEEKTGQFVYETLQSFGNLELSRPVGNSVVARLIGAKPGKVIAIRADMDALPVQEQNTFEFSSQNPGVMHACGHDAHTAMLLGTAKILSGLKDEIQGEVRFLFQHAEELFPGGGSEMVAAGVMKGVDQVIGAHVWSQLEAGKIGIAYGPMMAAPDTFHITIKGKGGHAGAPHTSVDSIVIGAQVVTNLQHIVARNIDPLDNVVISIGKFVAGTTDNVIPDSAEIVGTIRTLSLENRDLVPRLMEQVVKGVTEAHGAEYEFKLVKGYQPVINDVGLTRIMEETIREVLGDQVLETVRPTMIAEDFSAYQHEVPGSFIFIGAGNAEKGITYPHHHPRFTIDEDIMVMGVKLFTNAAFKLLKV
ncbi:N-acyl-L-amino acid amidohydrolase [Desulfosporosinus acididurans]|uniref:N-acyl-L-amino acid amidohydrolase n=1 Tax=Desulfosporosinus acididurans TaxID=476652 RepID=A0A0J1FVX0_9FIRM|nr:M20 family metallopeptidase [Desulfosporosinus acididurans]KLU67559.1 N-acyl-L-amino acid amidohydrolase [Desulfosporosinus acididurans]